MSWPNGQSISDDGRGLGFMLTWIGKIWISQVALTLRDAEVSIWIYRRLVEFSTGVKRRSVIISNQLWSNKTYYAIAPNFRIRWWEWVCSGTLLPRTQCHLNRRFMIIIMDQTNTISRDEVMSRCLFSSCRRHHIIGVSLVECGWNVRTDRRIGDIPSGACVCVSAQGKYPRCQLNTLVSSEYNEKLVVIYGIGMFCWWLFKSCLIDWVLGFSFHVHSFWAKAKGSYLKKKKDTHC